MLVVESVEIPAAKSPLAPGVLRSGPVRVGRHAAWPRRQLTLIKRFAETYTSPNLSRLREIIGVAASYIAWRGSTPSWTATAAFAPVLARAAARTGSWDQELTVGFAWPCA